MGMGAPLRRQHIAVLNKDVLGRLYSGSCYAGGRKQRHQLVWLACCAPWDGARLLAANGLKSAGT